MHNTHREAGLSVIWLNDGNAPEGSAPIILWYRPCLLRDFPTWQSQPSELTPRHVSASLFPSRSFVVVPGRIRPRNVHSSIVIKISKKDIYLEDAVIRLRTRPHVVWELRRSECKLSLDKLVN